MSFKDKLTMTLSIGAFIISGLSAYYNSFRQSDDVSAVFSLPPLPDWSESILTSSRTQMYMTLINSGNRSAVIGDGTLWFKQAATRGELDCTNLDFTDSPTKMDFEPMVLKEKEVLIRKLNIKTTGATTLEIPSAFESRAAAHWWVMVCATFSMVTPSSADFNAHIPLALYDSKSKTSLMDVVKDFRGVRSLLKHSGSIFW